MVDHIFQIGFVKVDKLVKVLSVLLVIFYIIIHLDSYDFASLLFITLQFFNFSTTKKGQALTQGLPKDEGIRVCWI